MDITNLENEIELLKKELNKKELDLIKLKMRKVKDNYYKNFEEIILKEEMELIYNLLFGYYLCSEYNKYSEYNAYLNKAAELLDRWPEELKKELDELFKLFEKYDELLSDEEMHEFIELYSMNIEMLENDPCELIEIFCK